MRGGTNLTAAPSLPASQTRALVGLWALAEVGGGAPGEREADASSDTLYLSTGDCDRTAWEVGGGDAMGV